ncbi:hypothetical protein K438DRAFT_2079370, partial [Mycena galopus ATCC 62051]
MHGGCGVDYRAYIHRLRPPPQRRHHAHVREHARLPARYWETVARHKVTQFYSAPTAVRLL